MAVYMAALQPGDTILSLELVARRPPHARPQGQLLRAGSTRSSTTASRARRTSSTTTRCSRSRRSTGPKLIVCGGSAYPRTVEADRFRAIADEVGALLLCDMAHFAGLVAAGLHPNPVEHCDFVTSTTHKTLAGPRAGFILCREEHAQAVDRAVFPGMQGGPLMHTIAAKATCFRIAGTEPFRDYQRQVRANADALSDELQSTAASTCSPAAPTRTCSSSTCARTEWTGKDAEERLAEVKLTVNRNTVPFDERPPTIASGVRIGTPAATMRGFDDEDFREVGRIICGALGDGPTSTRCAARAEALCAKRPLYPGFRGLHDLRRVSLPEQVTVVDHPLVQHKLSYLRDESTPTVHFRKLVNEVTLLLTYEATKDLPTEPSRSRRRWSG